METCPECGRPLARADDFWYCDNPDCPRQAAPRHQAEETPAWVDEAERSDDADE
jgi:uncharacterized Zn finger protein (UPF0148 family)